MIPLIDPIVVPRIETRRLILRALTQDDIPFVLEHFGKDEINEYASDDNVTSVRGKGTLREIPRPTPPPLSAWADDEGDW